jgi:chitin disaccharide deacetylase
LMISGIDQVEKTKTVFLIVNADDYGYSEGVSCGILDLARKGIVNGVGVLANSPFFDKNARSLLSVEQVDVGVHLNLTAGKPLTAGMADLLTHSGGAFPRNKYGVALSILSGRIGLAVVEGEWDAQIRRCLDAGLHVWFLNSHEHLHMLPPLYRVIRHLAVRHRIPYIRHTRAEWFGFPKPGNLARDSVLQILDWINRDDAESMAPFLLGVSQSGKLDLDYLEKRLATLNPGGVYELMCHPGYAVAGEEVDPRLRAYHDWQGEWDALSSAGKDGLLRSRGIRQIGFRDLVNLGKPATGSGAEFSR